MPNSVSYFDIELTVATREMQRSSNELNISVSDRVKCKQKEVNASMLNP